MTCLACRSQVWSLNGPVPSMWSKAYRSCSLGLLYRCHVVGLPSQSPWEAAHAFGITNEKPAMMLRNAPYGCARWNTTLSPWTVTALATSWSVTWNFPSPARVLSVPVGGGRNSQEGPPSLSCNRKRINGYRTSSGVILELSWNLTPLPI